jgi:hypothetical protein
MSKGRRRAPGAAGARAARAARRQARWPGRVLRGLRPDRNPLRRAHDRMETYLLAGLFLASAAAAPFAAQAASSAAYAAGRHAQQVELATTHEVRAVLAQLAGGENTTYSLSGYVPVEATWTSATGVRRTGEVLAPAGSGKGSTIPVWTDAAGNLVNPPLVASQVAGQGEMGAVAAIAGLGALYLCEAAIVRGVVNRRRLAAWDADWAVTAPAWNRQRW